MKRVAPGVRQLVKILSFWGHGGVLPVLAGALAGQAFQVTRAQLLSPGLGLLAAAALGACFIPARCRRALFGPGGRALVLSLLWGGCAGFVWADWRAQGRQPAADLQAMLPRGQPRAGQIEGQVVDLPQPEAEGVRLVLRVQRWQAQDSPGWRVPAQVVQMQLFWPAQPGLRPPEIRVGQHWRLPVIWRPVRGWANFTQRDPELWAWLRGVALTATVQARGPPQAAPLLIRPAPELAQLLLTAPGLAVDALRERWRQALQQHLAGWPAAVSGTLVALAVGDQQAIAPDLWQLYRDTGITHLMSISGLHITALAWLAGAALRRLWRLCPALMRHCPAADAGAIGGVLVALLYALMAGWGVPAQRTVCMLAVLTALGLWRLRWNAPMTLSAVAAAVLFFDPWAWLQTGFWLSFAAVGLLVLRGQRLEQDHRAEPVSGNGPQPALLRLKTSAFTFLGEQITLTVGLAPLTVLFFGQFSLLGLLANLVAVFWVTVLVLPLLFGGLLIPGLWTAAAGLVDHLLAVLRALEASVSGVWWLPLETLWPAWLVWPLAVSGVCAAVLARWWRWRSLGLLALLPAVWPWPDTPPSGRFELMALDIGQGTSVLLRTRHHTLLFDTGPVYGPPAGPHAGLGSQPERPLPPQPPDAGSRVIVPVLRALGVRQLDELVLSHSDQDHVGGSASVLAALPLVALTAALPDEHPLMALAKRSGARVRRCRQGPGWVWDGVRFDVIHPLLQLDPQVTEAALGRNAGSCVLRVQDAAGRAALIPGDTGVLQEADMLWAQQQGIYARAEQRLGPVEVLVAPHHGSHTSSARDWLAALKPPDHTPVVLIQAGAFNRYGHPHADVLARYRGLGYAVLRSDLCGAWRWRSDEDLSGSSGPQARCWRVRHRRYWQAGAL